MFYQEPKIEILELELKNIVCLSSEGDDSRADDSPSSGEWT